MLHTIIKQLEISIDINVEINEVDRSLYVDIYFENLYTSFRNNFFT